MSDVTLKRHHNKTLSLGIALKSKDLIKKLEIFNSLYFEAVFGIRFKIQ